MTSKRMSCHAVTSGNKLYVVGGYFGTQEVQDVGLLRSLPPIAGTA
uniref:Uncharacterized protein n=1 Tax=Anguilla anguilla TaxID=7936 RepID=A0A0E9SBP3_ANGAN